MGPRKCVALEVFLNKTERVDFFRPLRTLQLDCTSALRLDRDFDYAVQPPAKQLVGVDDLVQ